MTSEGRVIGAERNEMQIIRNFIGQADNADHPQKKRYGRLEMVGPFSVRDGEDNYQLYLIRPASTSQSDFINLLFDRPLLLLIVTMLVSAPLLLWLAWSLAKPARKLKNAADEVAQGNLRQHPELEAGPQEFLAAGASFNQMVTALERMMTSQQRLLSDISHELRTPLTRLAIGYRPAASPQRREQGAGAYRNRSAPAGQHDQRPAGDVAQSGEKRPGQRDGESQSAMERSVGQCGV